MTWWEAVLSAVAILLVIPAIVWAVVTHLFRLG